MISVVMIRVSFRFGGFFIQLKMITVESLT